MADKPPRATGGEHVVPYALGGSLTIKRVCRDCDNRLGNTADAGLINLSIIEQRRIELGLLSHSGVVPDRQLRAMKVPLIRTDDRRHRLMWKPGSRRGELFVKTLSHVDFDIQYLPDGLLITPSGVYIDPSDMDRVEMLARSALRKRGIKNKEQVVEIARQFAESLETVREVAEFHHTLQVRVGGHEDGLLKIAYELAWYWLGDGWLNDAIAEAMRDKLNGRTPKKTLLGKIYDDTQAGIVSTGGDPRAVHIAFLFAYQDRLLLCVRVFDLLFVGFQVSENLLKYSIPTKNAIVFDSTLRKYEEATFGRLPLEEP